MATALDKYKDKHNQRAERENNKQKCGATFGFFSSNLGENFVSN